MFELLFDKKDYDDDQGTRDETDGYELLVIPFIWFLRRRFVTLGKVLLAICFWDPERVRLGIEDIIIKGDGIGRGEDQVEVLECLRHPE